MDFQGCFSSNSSCGQKQSSPPLPPPSVPPYGSTTHAFFPAPSSLPDDHISFSCPLPRSPSSSCVHYRSHSDALTEDYYDGNKDGKNDDVFLISSKEASLERLRRWRQATLALNAVRRFRYTTDLGREAELDRLKQEAIKRLRAGTTAIRAIQRFKAAAGLSNNEVKEEDEEEDAAQGVSPPPNSFGVSAATLTSMMKNQDREILGRLGGPTGVAKSLRSDLENGLSGRPEEMLVRTEAFGANAFPRKPSKSLLVFFWEAFQDPTLAILMVCAALSLGFGMRSHGPKEGWYDGASIAFAVILVVFITAISDFNQFQQFKELGKEKQNIQLRVLREGRRPKISIYELVVGDVVPINTGDQVPADGLLIHGHQLSVDESSITGESEHVVIDRKHPFLLSGSKVADGYGLMLVVSVGTSTEWGSIMSSISSDVGEETPLQVRLNGVATFIGKMGLAVAVSVFVILMSFYFTGHRNGSDGSKFKAGHTKASAVVNSVVDIFSIAVTIIVVAVPEGLPLAVTLTLAYSMKKMMADRALVRRLSSCETMGSATTICSDKTGTLTLNEMTVIKACVGGEIVEPTENFVTLSSHIKTLLLEGIAYNTSGSVFVPVESGGEMEIIGSPTEKAILRWGLKSGMNYEGLKSAGVVLHVESFNSESKRAGVAVKAKESGRIYVHWKGAAEIILGLCDKSLAADGSVMFMGEERRAELLNVIGGMAASSLRCVAFACKEVTETAEMHGEALAEAWRMPESELTLLAIVGIKDPCRPEVREAVRRCQAAGVEVRMVTGDNLLTAKAIAAECGILQDGYYAIEGRDFRALTPEERKTQVSKICILARSSPTDKLLLVKTLKEIGHVVGVTGDGTNDAPALHAADVGLSMGIQGTEVAKESSDIIILDDNFSSVVKVVCWGRSVYANIQKFIQFQLTVNVAALSVNFVAAISSGSVPLTTVQLLWVNLIMDTLGALALATEPPNEDLMRRRPVGRRDPLITKLMWLHILSQAGYQITILLTLQFIGKPLLGLSRPSAEAVKNTMIFNSFVFCQIFNEVNARRPSKLNIFEGVFKNRLFVGIVASTAVAQVLIVEFLEKFASTTKLNGQQWLICLGLAFISWPIAFLVKFLPIQRLNNIVNMRTC